MTVTIMFFCSFQDLNFDLDNDILEDVDTQVSVIHTGGCAYNAYTPPLHTYPHTHPNTRSHRVLTWMQTMMTCSKGTRVG